MKVDVIKPKKEVNPEKKSVFTPIVYLLLGVVLAFKSNEAVTIMFYLLGILAIVYGIKSFIDYTKYKDLVQYRKMSLSVAIAYIILGILVIVLAQVLELSIRYILGFFLIFFGFTRILSQISYGDYFNLTLLSNIILIILGIFSIFVSNVILVIAGWLLIINAVILFLEYFKN